MLFLKGVGHVNRICPGPFHTIVLNNEGDMFVFGASNEGKLGVFRLEERMIAMGAQNEEQDTYIIDWPWQLTEEIPRKWAISHDSKDIFD